MTERITTFAIVTIITLFVWALAESQTLQSDELSFEVILDPSVSGRALRLAPSEAWDARMRVELTGPTSAIDDIGRAASEEGVRLRIGREVPLAEGEVTIDMRDAIASAPMFRGRGVRVQRADPPRIRIEVEPLERRKLPVTVVLGAGEAEAPPTPEPAEVEVVGPASWIQRLPPNAMATVSAASLSALRPGEASVVPGVPVGLEDLPDGAWGLAIEPSQVSATVTLRRRTATTVIPSLPIEVILAPAQAGRWRVSIPEERAELIDLALRGSATSIAQVGTGRAKIRALVDLSGEKLTAGTLMREVRLYGLPSGVGTVEAGMMAPVTVAPIAEAPQE